MSVFTKLFGDPSIGPGEKLWAVVNNMIPVAGVLLLGWEAGPVLLLLWLDGWLGIWEIAGIYGQSPINPNEISGGGILTVFPEAGKIWILGEDGRSSPHR